MTGSASLADDITQDAFIMLMEQGDKFDESKGQVLSFLLGIARNFVRRAYRSQTRNTPLIAENEEGEEVELALESGTTRLPMYCAVKPSIWFAKRFNPCLRTTARWLCCAICAKCPTPRPASSSIAIWEPFDRVSIARTACWPRNLKHVSSPRANRLAESFKGVCYEM